jgi:hypothetical protein
MPDRHPWETIGSLITDPFMERLDKCVPEQCPDPSDSEREIWMKAGERRLVLKLRMKQAEYLEDSMN